MARERDGLIGVGLSIGQCRAILLLKLRLWRNMMSPSKILSLAAGAILLLLAVFGSVAGSVGMFFLASTVLVKEAPHIVLAIMNGLIVLFVAGWAWGVLIELKRSDHLDFRKMLYFPISMKALFALNFCGALLSPALLFFAPSAAGLLVGLVYGGQANALWIAPFAVVFFLMIAAWSYYFHGIVASWMENKRRRRFLMTIFPVFFVLLAQTPWLVTRSVDSGDAVRSVRQWLDVPENQRTLLWATTCVPIGWLPLGVWAVTARNVAAAIALFAALAFVTTVGWFLGYRATLRHYLGNVGTIAAPSRRVARTEGGTPWTCRRLPWLSDDASALTIAMFLGYARHPHIRLQLIMPICMGLVFGVYFSHRFDEEPDLMAMSWLPAVVIMWPFLNFAHFMFNVFGTDRNGFRGLILLPAWRDRYLMCKNLALFPFVGGLAFVFLIIGALLFRPTLILFLVSMLQVFQLYLLCCTLGNFISLWFPYAVSRDMMRRQRNQGLMFLVGLITMAILALVTLPTAACLMLDSFAATWWDYEGPSLALLASLGLLGITALVYTTSLRYAGDLLLAREQRILEVLVRDRE